MWTGTLKRQSRRCCQQVGLLWRQAAHNEHDLQPHGGPANWLPPHSLLKCERAVLHLRKQQYTSKFSRAAAAPCMELNPARLACAVWAGPACICLQPAMAVASNALWAGWPLQPGSPCVHPACRATPRAATPLPRRPSWRGRLGHACSQGPQPLPAPAACGARQCTLPDGASRWAALYPSGSCLRARNPC